MTGKSKPLLPPRAAGTRIKKEKVIFDPSDYEPTRKNSNQISKKTTSKPIKTKTTSITGSTNRLSVASTSSTSSLSPKRINQRDSPVKSGTNQKNITSSKNNSKLKKHKQTFEFEKNTSLKPKKSNAGTLSSATDGLSKKRKKSNDECCKSNFYNEDSSQLSRYLSYMQNKLLNDDDVDDCVVCERFEAKNKSKLIKCRDCSIKIHIECIGVNFQHKDHVEGLWRCKNCMTCIICNETGNKNNIAICCTCIDGYHYKCHKPKLEDLNINKTQWTCYKCLNLQIALSSNDDVPLTIENTQNDEDFLETIAYKEEKDFMLISVKEENKSPVYGSNKSSFSSSISQSSRSSATPSNLSRHSSESSQSDSIDYEKNENKIDKKNDIKLNDEIHTSSSQLINYFLESDKELPDIEMWSSEELSNFIERFSPDAAKVFRDEEIDGYSCLLLERSDVIKLGFPLDVALKLHILISGIKKKTKDLSKIWPMQK